MGIQFHCKRETLEAAGWKCSVEVETFTDDETGEVEEFPQLVAEKDGHKFYSYCEDCLVVDANHWGSNRSRLIAAGLFDLEHWEG